MAQPPFPPPQAPAPQCYRHPGRVTYINCQRCGRPICPECMISAAVGFQCPECVAAGMRQTRQNQGPYGGERSKNPALTTIVLMATNVAVWLLFTLTGGHGSWWFWRLALSPTGSCVVSSNPNQFYPGATWADCTMLGSQATWMPGVADGAPWQLLTSAFSHLDVMHLGFNMLALWFLGPQLERVVGRARFLALYFVSALTGSAAVLWLSDPSSNTLGASGAVFGLLGALLVLVLKVKGNAQSILMWLGLNIAYTFFGPGSISWQGHLGGLVGGAVIAAIIAYAPRQNRTRTQWLGIAGLAALTVVLIAVRILQLSTPALALR
ncbi:MAG: rhomboid family intramembrane serine protease [Propionibacteriaceae bacterium]|nr:rhomboid family intramembrane serine protease [Propionibacteriaceae bacterium]